MLFVIFMFSNPRKNYFNFQYYGRHKAIMKQWEKLSTALLSFFLLAALPVRELEKEMEIYASITFSIKQHKI